MYSTNVEGAPTAAMGAPAEDNSPTRTRTKNSELGRNGTEEEEEERELDLI